MSAVRPWPRAMAMAIGLALVLVGCTDGGGERLSSPTTRSHGRAPTPDDPLRVLVVGDSVMFDAEPAIEAILQSAGEARVTSQTILGLGLVRGEWDWRREWATLVDQSDPEAVVVLVGAWDLLTDDRAGPAPGSAAWVASYRSVVGEAADLLTAGGAHVYWLGMPWVAADAHRQPIAALNRLLDELATTRADVTFVDAAAALAGADGGFAAALPGDDGRLEPVRKADGVHLCPAGAARLATVVLAALRVDWPVARQAGWEDGPWREDQRYRWERGGGCPPAT